MDELEQDLTAVRRLLNRDLANLRNKRAERERAAGVARLQNGQPKPIKKEPKANGNAGQHSGQAASNVDNETKGVKIEPKAEPTTSSADPAPVSTEATSLDELDSMFMGDLGGSTGLGLNSGVQTQNQGLVNGTAMSTDELFTDGAMNIDGADFSLLGTNEDSGDISTLLPGLEKYVNQNQDTSGASGGQTAEAGVDGFDLDALLEEMTGGAGASQGQGSTSASDGKASNGKDSKAQVLTTGTDSSAGAPTGQASNSNDNVPAENVDGMDFSNENTFDIDFDGLTAGAADGSTLAGGDADINDWFNFD